MRALVVLPVLWLVGCGNESSARAAPVAPAAPVARGETFGAALSLPEATPLAELLANPDRFQGKVVRTTGVIRSVCPHRGCWFDIGAANNSGGRLHVRSLDHAITVPIDSAGKEADVEGEVQVLPGTSACGSSEEHQVEGALPACGVAAAGRRAQLALRGAVVR